MNTHFEIATWEPRRAGMMVEARERSQVPQALIHALHRARRELRAGPDVDIYVRDDGRGKALILPEPVPAAFVAALMLALPGAALIPVDLDEVPIRLLMRIGREGLLLLAPTVETQTGVGG